MSFNCCSSRPGPERPSWSTGTLEALYWMTDGGVVPGGRERNCTWLMAVTWATASPTFTLGWKKILMTPMPTSDWDSMWSMSLTAVVMPRSALVTMRLAIWSADKPLKFHITVTTGISMLGKMSVGIDSML